MALQQGISLEKNQAWVGKTLPVLVEGFGAYTGDDGAAGNGISLGRSFRDAPEIDGMVLIEGEAPSGKIIPVHITGAMTYDLSGTHDSTN
jgi:ribosomal protein S12 methylthiotransferase